ncbi:MAG: hypothetical protein IPK13_14155 [Deltaproteobacteria bacterium]|nr:hypothetical protein [Deltaproteobacteria bacterium]
MYFEVGRPALRRRRLRAGVRVLAPLMALSCSGGATCGEQADGDSGGYVYPEPETIQRDVGRVRITQDFLDFIRPQLSKAIRAALSATGESDGSANSEVTIDDDDVLHLEIPDAELLDIGVAKADLRNAEAYLWMSELADKLELTFEEPSSVRVKFTDLRLGLAFTLKEEALGADSACPVFSELGPDGPGPLPHAALIDVEAFITAGAGPDPDRNLDVRMAVDGIDINDLALEVADSSVYCSEPECQDCALEIGSTCSDPGGRCAECVTFCGAVTDATLTLASTLIDIIAPLIRDFITSTVERVIDQALAGLNATPAKVETQASLADTAGLSASPATHPVGLFVGLEPGDFPVVDRGTGLGMELPLAGGATGEASACVPIQDAFVPTRSPLPTLPPTDKAGRPYHLGATLSASFLNQVLWAVEGSGQLCLNLTTRDIFTLTDGSFILNASVLSLLASELTELASNEAPIMVELKPRHAGRIELGSNEVIGMDSDGNDVLDWMVKLSLEELGIAFHVRIHDRYVRVFEVTTDIFVGLSLQALHDDDRLEISVGEIRIDNFEEDFNELLRGTDFAQILPVIVDLALGAVLNDDIKLNLDLDDALSSVFPGDTFGLRINEIFRDGIEDDHLTMTLTVTTSTASAFRSSSKSKSESKSEPISTLRANANTSASSIPSVSIERGKSGLVVPAPFGTGTPGRSTGRLHLTAKGDEGARSYQVRVDHGVWRHPRRPQPGGDLTTAVPILRVPGHHTVEVRRVHMRADGRRFADPQPVSFDVFVDLTSPEITSHVSLDREEVMVEVFDNQPQSFALTLLGRRPGEDRWFEIPTTPAPQQEPAVGNARSTHGAILDARERLEIVAVDASGNTSAIHRTRLSNAANPISPSASAEVVLGSRVDDADSGGCRCVRPRAAPNGDSVFFVGLGIVAAVVLPRMKRRRVSARRSAHLDHA